MPPLIGYLTASSRYVWHFDRFTARQRPLFNAGMPLILQNLDQLVFGSRISNGQKTNWNTIFEVWIFKLRLTSPVGGTIVKLASAIHEVVKTTTMDLNEVRITFEFKKRSSNLEKTNLTSLL